MAQELEKENQELKEELLLLKKDLNYFQYKVLFEASPDIILQIDLQYKILVCHIPGFSVEKMEALRGRNLIEITPEEFKPDLFKALEKVFSFGTTVQYQTEGTVSGAYFYYQNYISPIKDASGKIYSYYIVAREITAQRLSEKAIQESERKLKALFGSSQHLHVLLDLEQKLVWFNKRSLEISKFLFEQPLEVGLKMADFLRVEFQDKFTKDFERSKKGEVVLYERHYMIHDSQSFYLEMMLQPVYEAGELIAISLVGVETTERRLNEEKLEKVNHELVQQNERLNQYSYIISHNLRGPIVTLLGLVTLFEQNKDSLFREEVVGHIKTSTLHLDNIIRDLNMVLSQTGKDLNKTDVDLDEELKIVQALLKGQIEEVGLVLHSDFSKIRKIYTVKSFLQSILLNLMSNSLKYKKKDTPLKISVMSHITPDQQLCLTFADNGMGFDLEKNKDKVFNIYKRFHPQIEGKGLGLHLVKTQIELMGGRIEVESEVDMGATFRIYLGI